MLLLLLSLPACISYIHIVGYSIGMCQAWGQINHGTAALHERETKVGLRQPPTERGCLSKTRPRDDEIQPLTEAISDLRQWAQGRRECCEMQASPHGLGVGKVPRSIDIFHRGPPQLRFRGMYRKSAVRSGLFLTCLSIPSYTNFAERFSPPFPLAVSMLYWITC